MIPTKTQNNEKKAINDSRNNISWCF